MSEETNEKAEYLRREEVRTMEKDLGRLREKEAEAAREGIAKLRTEEEARQERYRLERAKREAEERRKAEETVKQKEEDLGRLKEEREAREIEAKGETEEKKISERQELRERLREIQAREEEERKKFLERVGAQAAPPAPPLRVPPKETPLRPPVPPKPPRPPLKIPKVPVPKISGVFPQKPSWLAQVWARIAIILFLTAALATMATFWYWYLVIRRAPIAETPAATETPVPVAPETPEIPLVIRNNILSFGSNIPEEPRTIDTIIIHSVYNALGEDPHGLDGVIEEYQIYGVTAHYLIDRAGTIYQTALDEAVAYHAGKSQMPDSRTDVNSFSLGIELIYAETETPNEVQYQSLAQVIKHLQKEYNIPSRNILGHKDVAPARKTDPWNFDWEYFQSLIK